MRLLQALLCLAWLAAANAALPPRNVLPIVTEPAGKLQLVSCTQRDTEFSGACARAIDGDLSQKYNSKSCSHTGSRVGNWWTGGLRHEAAITHVKIYNRQDCCAERLNDFVIEVDGRQCAEHKSTTPFSVKTFACNAIGRSVTIRSRLNSYLTLCEVQVFGRELRRDKLQLVSCTQRDTEFSGACARAIDGDLSQKYNSKSCSHTGAGVGNWWTGRLRHVAAIKHVTIYNRQDCCAERLNDFVIEVDGRRCAEHKSTTPFSVKTFTCNAIGSYVTIRSRLSSYLTLCEVQVFGKALWLTRDISLRLRKCSQKNNAYPVEGHCGRAIDGDTSQRWDKKSCTHTKGGFGNWWSGHLSELSAVSRVTIFNRQDCCQDRLNDFVIEVDGRQCAEYKSAGVFSVRTFECNAVGSIITVRSRKVNAPLTLCEVQAFGVPVAGKNSVLDELQLRRCSQKTDQYKNFGACERAIDGNTEQMWDSHSCTHTKAGGGNWWTGHLNQAAAIARVTIYNRQDCCKERLNDFIIEVDGKKCAEYKSTGVFSVKTFVCKAVGKSVTVRSRKTAPLTLCEVKVFGRIL